MISEKELVEMEQRPEREDVRPLIAEIRRLNRVIRDMGLPDEPIPHEYGSPL